MTLRQVYDYFIKSLSTIYEKQEAENITSWLLEEKLGLTRTGIVLHENEIISEVKANELAFQLLRLMKGEPVQYVLGYAEFYGLKLLVNKEVLIPRPETEELVDWVLKEEPGFQNQLILDIGTGSGCIAIALKKNLPQSIVHAMDVSKEALKVAQNNALNNGVVIVLLEADILSVNENRLDIKYDLIISNPPYIPESESGHMQKNVVDFEPRTALFVSNEDPLQFYHAILDFSANQLREGGFLYLEMHENYAQHVESIVKSHGYQQVIIKKDMQGKSRMLKARR